MSQAEYASGFPHQAGVTPETKPEGVPNDKGPQSDGVVARVDNEDGSEGENPVVGGTVNGAGQGLEDTDELEEPVQNKSESNDDYAARRRSWAAKKSARKRAENRAASQ